MNTKILKLGSVLIAIFLGSWSLAAAATTFYSKQVGTSPVNGYYLKTDGTNSTWAAVSGGSGTGTVSTSTIPTVGQIAYWTSNGFPSLLGSVATSTLTAGTGLTGSFTHIGTGGSLSLDNTGNWAGTWQTYSPSHFATFGYPFPSNATSTALTFTATTTFSKGIVGDFFKSINSSGIDLYTSSGSTIATFGAGGGSNATFTGGVNISGALGVTGKTTLGYASTTATSATTLCLSTDCRTAWPTGTVSSVAATVPTGWSVTGSPVTTTGTLGFSYAAGYAAVKTASTTNWNGFYNTPSTRITAGTNLSWSGNTLNATGGSGTFAWTPHSWGVSTSTTLGFLAGFLSTASSTINSSFYLPALKNPAGKFLAVDPTGLVIATTSPISSGVGGVETPSGTINGSNAVFTTTYSPLAVFLNGIFQSAAGVDYTLTGTGPYTITFVTAPPTGSILRSQYANGTTGGSGTVTSVALTTPTGLTVTGSPITTSGTLALALQSGYNIPLTASTTDWNTAYLNRITSLTTTGTSGAATLSGNTLNIPQYAGTTYTAAYPVTLTGSAFGLAFGTTTSNTWAGTQTFGNASTTLLTVTGSLWTPVTSALHLSDSAGKLTNYTGTSCTNQFARSISAAGVATCSSVALASDVSGYLGVGNIASYGATGVLTSSAISTSWSPFLSISRGGTGTSTAPTYGKLLIGDSAGNYEFTATSTLGLAPATSGTSILYGNGTGGFSNVTVGSGLSFAAGTLSATGGGSSFAYPFPGNATTTVLTLSNGVTLGNSVTLSGITGSAQCLHVNSSGVISGTGSDCGTGGGGTPGGSSGQVQYNNGGVFGGASNLWYISATGRLGIGTSSPSSAFAIASTSSITTGWYTVATSSTTYIDLTHGNNFIVYYGTSAMSIVLDAGGMIGQRPIVKTCGPATATGGALTWSAASGAYLTYSGKKSGVTFPGNTTLAGMCDEFFFSVEPGPLGSTTPQYNLTGMEPGN
jgi:hypothetical protein